MVPQFDLGRQIGEAAAPRLLIQQQLGNERMGYGPGMPECLECLECLECHRPVGCN